MHAPAPAQLLEIWERGGDQPAATRALLLLESACAEIGAGDLASLPLGRRDGLLLELRAQLFGPEVVGVAACPHCAGRVEATFRCADLLATSPHARSDAAHPSTLALDANGMRVRYRLPDSRDLLAIGEQSDVAAARAVLLERCVLEAMRDDEAIAACGLPEATIEQLSQAMAAADPQADLSLAFTCPDCGHAWECVFDVVHFLWQELHAWAQRLLREVDALARAYHWRERDILALDARRRQAYLELCAS